MRLAVAAVLVAMAGLPGGARADGWGGYQVLMWQDRTAAQWRGLARLGFTGGKVTASGGAVDAKGLALLKAAGVKFYLENLATDFYSAYHRWSPGRSVTWLFDEARARHRADPSDPAPFIREPSLSDPNWLAAVPERLERAVRQEPGALFYNLGDETGIADLAAAWDFDRGPMALAAFRGWLRGQYADLAALNREWGTGFAGWDDVVPEGTDQAVAKVGDNFAAWCDFKGWMDEAFAGAIRAGAAGVRRGGAGALAGLEGGQVPGWGGYDYALLAPAVDVMEIYDFGEALDLATAFNPNLIPLRTSFGRGAAEAHAAWRHLLHGGRGMVVWDEADDVVGADGLPLPRGREIGALVQALAAVAPRLGAASPDAVAVLSSQASFRVQWLLDRRAGDHDWAARDAEREYDDSAWRASRRVMVRHLAALGVQPRFVSSAMLEQGVLGGAKLLLLPHAIALSDQEVAGIEAFRAGGGTVLADTEPGLFDGHGRRRAAAPLPGVPHPQGIRPQGQEDVGQAAAMAGLLKAAGVEPRVQMLTPDGSAAPGLEARWFEGAQGRVLAVQAAEPWTAPPRLMLRFAEPVVVQDIRHGRVWPAGQSIMVEMDGIEPLVLLLGP